ncbi:MAG: hypothetical protein M1819_001411 [Sarea resinae]|nr:MAG: hypothetical protein M1819_001411 [Sarea resinae]
MSTALHDKESPSATRRNASGSKTELDSSSDNIPETGLGPEDARELPKEEAKFDDGGESGEEQRPQPVGFWDPSLDVLRKEIFLKWGLTTLILCVFVLSVLSIYWGALFHIEQNVSSLVVYVVDFDGQVAPYNNTGEPAIVGPAITQLAEMTVQASPVHLGLGSLPPSHFDNDPMNVRRAVYDFKAWAAIIINANATAMLRSAIRTGNTSYDPLGACQVIYMDSRDDTNWYDFIYPMLSTFMTQATTNVGETWTRMVLQNASDPTVLANLQKVPQAISPAIGFSMFNLRPFYPFVSIPSVSIGLIYLIILSFFSAPFYMPIHMKFLRPPSGRPLKFQQLVIWRLVATLTAYFFVSLAYSLISLAFQIPFSNAAAPHTEVAMNADAYGKGTFPVYWMLNFVGMTALGLACENMVMVVGQPWTAMWLIFWVITNVSTSFYDIDLAPRFYYWGYAWPLHQIVEASRQLLFGLHSRLGLNFGILFAWCAVNIVLFGPACWFLRYKQMHGIKEYFA